MKDDSVCKDDCINKVQCGKCKIQLCECYCPIPIEKRHCEMCTKHLRNRKMKGHYMIDIEKMICVKCKNGGV